jgi:hypothetical protein
MIDKEKIRDSIERMPDDASFDDALYRLRVLQKIELGLKDIEADRVFDFDEVFDELLDEHTSDADSERRGEGRSARNNGVHRKRRPKNGAGIRQKAKSSGG